MFKKYLRKWGLVKRQKHSLSASVGHAPKNGPQKQNRMLLQDSSVAAGLQCQKTLLPSPVSGLHAPLAEKSLGHLLAGMHNWVLGVADMPRTSPFMTVSRRSREMLQTFTLAADLLLKNEGLRAGKAMRKVFLQLEDAIHDLNVDVMWNMLDIVYELSTLKQNTLLDIFTRHLSAISQQRLPSTHPIAELAHQMLHLDAQHLKLARAYSSNTMDQLLNHSPMPQYKREVIASCLARLDRCSGKSPDPFMAGVWSLQKRPYRKSTPYDMHWCTIMSRLAKAFKVPIYDGPDLRRGGSSLRHDGTWEAERQEHTDQVVLDAKTRLDNIAVQACHISNSGATHALSSRCQVRYGNIAGDLSEIREMWALEKHLHLISMFDEARQMRKDSLALVDGFLSDIPQ